jgi:NAD(P)-dependent dehydrogenase (short-subunit alcohol dehydrogenase family)
VREASGRSGRSDRSSGQQCSDEQAGALEEISLEEAKTQFETNFCGVVRMIKAALPLMRQQK